MKLEEYLDNAKKYKQDYYTKAILIRKDDISVYNNSKLAGVFNEVLNKEANLISKLVEDKDIEKYLSVYHYLLWNGYFSDDNRFEYKKNNNELDTNLALSIAAGNGCCRNIALHFNKIINTLNKEKRFILVGTRYENNSKIKTEEEIESKDTSIYVQKHAESYDTKQNIIYDAQNFNIQRVNYDDLSKDNFIGTFDLGLESVFGIDEETQERLDKLEQRLDKSTLLAYAKKEPKREKELTKLRNIGIEICEDNKEKLIVHKENLNETYEYIKKALIKK